VTDDIATELAELTHALRAQLARHAAAGTWAAPGGATARPTAADAVEAIADPVAETVAHAARATLPQCERSEPAGRAASKMWQIRTELGECTRCKLHATRRSIVFGVGADDAPLMFVGEAPGEQEDKRGEPFVGPAGELLDKMIEAMGWSRQTVYIANILMCRPPGNRNPQSDEVAACKPFLDAKIRAIAPRVIVALGRPSANTLLGTDAPISALRGRFHDRHGVKVMPTFHPAYLLREPDRKRDAWADLKIVMAELARLGIAAPQPRG
jgi:uracil-DNA glycosylase family 4